MERLKKIIADGVFVLQILIIFVLLFENRIAVPAVLQTFGRLHPLLLHFPIGLLIVTVALLYSRRYFEGGAIEKLTDALLHFTAITASMTTLMGLFLSLEGSFGDDQLRLHKWLGVALSFVCWGLLTLKNNERILKPVASLATVLLVFTGHYGANLTHGVDYVWAPLQQEELPVAQVAITDSTTLFAATIEPIFAAKCAGCHNPKKAKGNLILTRLEDMLKGGESGPLWHGGSPSNSLLVERILLPLDHDDHMPPKDKAQLTEDEVSFISLWIAGGADTRRKLKDLASEDTLSRLSSAIVAQYQQVADHPQYTFDFVSPDKIRQLSQPNRSVFQIAKNEPAVQADFFLRESFESRQLEELLALREQLVSLNLSKMPVKDSDLDIIAKFASLEILNLNNTAVTGQGLSKLSSLRKLKALSLSGTDVDLNALSALAGIQSLQEVFIWNTRVSAADVDRLKKELPTISWNIGFVPDEKEILKLNPPLVRNKSKILERDERIILRHNLPGTEMRYTSDGSLPDSVNGPMFSDPLEPKGSYTVIKAQAFKEGWLSSDVAEFFFFRKGFQPDTVILETNPDERFKGEGAITLVDGKQGLPDFYRHPAWMAFKDNDLVLSFSFGNNVPTVRNVTLSFAHNNWSICMPPDQLELWGGNDASELQLIAKSDPPEGPAPAKARIEGLSMDVPPSEFKHYKLVAKPVRKLANGNPNKRTIWLMVDEVFIN